MPVQQVLEATIGALPGKAVVHLLVQLGHVLPRKALGQPPPQAQPRRAGHLDIQ